MIQTSLENRYQRNHMAITPEDQGRLRTSTVAIVGCGGLGGFMAEELARLGIGKLILIDGDKIEVSNLNRQLMALENNLGEYKVKAGEYRIKQVNSEVQVEAKPNYFRADGEDWLKEADLVCDALDNIPSRIELEKACSELGIPLVFSAIAGWYGWMGVSYPGDFCLTKLYGDKVQPPENKMGNPAFTPAVLASMAVAEAVKVLLGRPSSLSKSVLYIDLLEMEFNRLEL